MRMFLAWTLLVEIASIMLYFGHLVPTSPAVAVSEGWQWLNLALGYAIGVMAVRRFWS